MKNKLFNFVLAICLIIPCAFMFSACGSNSDLTKEDYIEAFESVTTTYDQYLTSAQPASMYLNANITSDDFIDVDNNESAKRMAKASLAMVHFMKNICENENYTLKTTPEDCVVNDGNEIYDIRMTMSYNTTTSIINAGTYVDYRDSTTLQYFLFEINYDFNTKTLNSFSILGLSGTDTEKTSAGVRYYTFENNTLKVLDNTAESFEPFAQEILAEMEILSTPERETNPADYSAEYIAAMNTAQGE